MPVFQPGKNSLRNCLNKIRETQSECIPVRIASIGVRIACVPVAIPPKCQSPIHEMKLRDASQSSSKDAAPHVEMAVSHIRICGLPNGFCGLPNGFCRLPIGIFVDCRLDSVGRRIGLRGLDSCIAELVFEDGGRFVHCDLVLVQAWSLN